MIANERELMMTMKKLSTEARGPISLRNVTRGDDHNDVISWIDVVEFEDSESLCSEIRHNVQCRSVVTIRRRYRWIWESVCMMNTSSASSNECCALCPVPRALYGVVLY